MELSQIDKESILNPIIDELGIISETVREKILIQLSAQFDRILLDGYVRAMNDVLATVKDIRSIQSGIQNAITGVQTDQTDKMGKMVKTLRTMHEEIKISMVPPAPPEVKVEEPVKTNERELALKEMKFGELIKIAKEKKINIKPRTKKEDLVNLILDIEKGEV